jgi:flagellar basal-body rod modification protein FlgD
MSAIASGLSSALASNSSSSQSSSANPYNLSPEDFINLMVTQLKNQDPTQPTSNQDLLAQMSQIGQLESSTQLQTTMASVTLQTQIGSASSLIGKSVTGLDSSNNSVTGNVKTVSVAGGSVTLNLDTGDTMTLSQLSAVNGAATASNASSGTTTN